MIRFFDIEKDLPRNSDGSYGTLMLDFLEISQHPSQDKKKDGTPYNYHVVKFEIPSTRELVERKINETTAKWKHGRLENGENFSLLTAKPGSRWEACNNSGFVNFKPAPTTSEPTQYQSAASENRKQVLGEREVTKRSKDYELDEKVRQRLISYSGLVQCYIISRGTAGDEYTYEKALDFARDMSKRIREAALEDVQNSL